MQLRSEPGPSRTGEGAQGPTAPESGAASADDDPAGDAPTAPRPAPDAAAVAGLLESLAHDLRSPLGVVTEALGSLRSDFADQMTDDHRLLGALADRGLRRLRHLADQVALAASLESGAFELRRSSVDLADVVRAAAASAVAIEPRREVALATELSEEPSPLVADADRLSSAVGEVVINAVRHARHHVHLHLAVVPDGARITVEDDGQGVPVERRATLFQRFAPRPSRAGLGLGLSTAHDVIAAHGGRITLEASTLPPGRPGTTGARFVIWLPSLW